MNLIRQTKHSAVTFGRSIFSQLTAVRCYSDNYSSKYASTEGYTSGNHSNNQSNETSLRAFASYSIYKGKSALRLSPKKPIFGQTEKGDFILKKDGGVMLEFANALGTRKYDWQNKQMFFLSAVEMASVLTFKPPTPIEFFHDPSMGKQGQGSTTKVLQIALSQQTCFFSLTVRSRGSEAKVSTPVSEPEFAIIKSAFSFSIPHVIGWNAVFNPLAIEEDMLEQEN